MATLEERPVGARVAGAGLPAARALASRYGLLMVVILVAAVARFATIGIPTFWYDEYLTVTDTHKTLAGMLQAVHDVEVNPPLYFIVAWVWQKVFGSGEIALRSLSALLGTVTVPIVYATARALASRRAGLFAAALTATNPFLIWYSQEARAYALLVPLAALSLLFFVYSIQREEQRWLWGWMLASGLALATHYFAVALILPEAVWLLLRARAPRVRVALACAGVGAVGVALLPLWAHQHSRPRWIAELSASDRLLALPQHFLVGLSVPWRALPIVVACVVAGAVLYGLRKADERSRRAFALAGGVGGAGMALTLVPMLFGVDYVITRNVIELWLPLAIAVAIVLAAGALRSLGAAVVLGLCLSGLALSIWNAATPAARRVDWDDVAHAIGGARGQRVIAAPGMAQGAPLLLQLDRGRLAKPGERLATRDLVLLWLRPVPNYAIGPCWWGAACGGETRGGSGPPFPAPSQFRLVRKGSTARVTYRIYRARRPVVLPHPTTLHNVIVQAPLRKTSP